jgi:hypothetical protein
VAKPSAAVYIDGFNLYWGSLRTAAGTKWLDIVALSDDLLRGCTVQAVHYYTARVDDRPEDPGQSHRQDVFLQALAAHSGPRLHIVYGTFRTGQRRMRLVRPLPDGSSFARVWRTEEKASDVNLGAQVVWDACHGAYDVACVISNDSDLQTPLDMAMAKGLQVVTINPHLHHRQPNSLAGTEVRRLTLGRLRRCRLPDPVLDTGGVAWHCPPAWKA